MRAGTFLFVAGLAIGAQIPEPEGAMGTFPVPGVKGFTGQAETCPVDDGTPGHIAVTGKLTSADHELEEGEFAVGQHVSVRVNPAGVPLRVFKTYLGREVHVVIRPVEWRPR